MNNYDTLLRDIKRLGIKENDTLFLRISYKAIGKTEGGPETIIQALLSAIGPGGTLIATAFPRRIPARKKEKYKNFVYEKGMQPTTGIIPVMMSRNPNAFFSSHPISPYVAIGFHAEEITKMHTPSTDSYDVVAFMIERYNCKCLRIGGHVLDGTTHLAFTEGLKKNAYFQYRMAEGNYYLDSDGEKRWLEKSVSAFCYDGFERFFYEKVYKYPGAIISEGLIGEGKSVLTNMRKTLEVERLYIATSPQILLCDSPRCHICRTSFSYSDQSVTLYALHQLRYLIQPKHFKETAAKIKTAFKNRYLGTKCQ